MSTIHLEHLQPVPYMLVTSNLSMRSNLRLGFFGLPSLLFSRCLRSRRRLSCRSFSSSGLSTLPGRSATEDSEFRRGPPFFGDVSTGSAKMSSSAVGRPLLEATPIPPLFPGLWPRLGSSGADGRRPGGGRGRMFSLRLATDEYGGGFFSSVSVRLGGGRMLLLPEGLSPRVRLSYMSKLAR